MTCDSFKESVVCLDNHQGKGLLGLEGGYRRTSSQIQPSSKDSQEELEDVVTDGTTARGTVTGIRAATALQTRDDTICAMRGVPEGRLTGLTWDDLLG